MRALRVPSLVLAVLVGCGGGGSGVDGGETVCHELGHRCHPYDRGPGPAHDCHELGHSDDEAMCIAMQASCEAICSGDAGPPDPEDAGAIDAE